MNWSLPLSVVVGETTYNIRNKCDYRVVLDVFDALVDKDLNEEDRLKCALFIFYEDLAQLEDVIRCKPNDYNDTVSVLTKEMLKIINMSEDVEGEKENHKPKMMDWHKDFPLLAPPISRILGYDVRTPEKITHWYSFWGAYMEIGGECLFATIVSIRSKRAKGKKLEKWEEEFYNENREKIDLNTDLSEEEMEWLFMD